jgi:membrane protein
MSVAGRTRRLTEFAEQLLDRVDRLQQRTRWLGFPYAVYQKFSDDQAANLASMLTYYAFFSVFPLLLVLVTILGFVLHGDPHLETRVFDSAVGLLPIVGEHSAIHPLVGNVPALVIGSALALWNGLGVAQQAQSAFNTVYDVPRRDWPGLVPSTLRSIAAVSLGGTGFIATTLITGAVTGAGSYGLPLGIGPRVVGAVVAIVLDTVLFTLLFRDLTARDLGWRDTLPGACVAGAGWYTLQLLGTALVAHELKGAESTYGTFAAVIGLLSFFYVQAQLTLYAAEINAVRTYNRWPRGLRSLSNVPTTDADRRSYQAYAQRQRFADPDREVIDVTYVDEVKEHWEPPPQRPAS